MSSESTCDRLHRALSECHRRVPSGPARESACRHLNHGLAMCLVSLACRDEAEAVRSLCSSSGTALKRSQCQQANLSLSVCLSSHQQNS
ncbi:Cytochrome c oxidase biogenesis protein Cmc1-like [Senna tora]|uniref:Cytochrome c oxidase biogenesis protein Cmc1-like n=1 Tax=Senna tora TaxID=362788 RepID=A0A834SDH1_9FABA|nr:Cytochrome c oxidase biogenesis protein Cmc1-like [Senna tora]